MIVIVICYHYFVIGYPYLTKSVSVRLIFFGSVYQVTHQLLILYHFTAYFMDVLSHRVSVTLSFL